MTSRHLAFVVGLVVLHESWAQGEPTSVPTPPPTLVERLDALYQHRDESDAMREAGEALQQALKAAGGEYSVLWRCARHNYWMADRAVDDRAKKDFAQKGWKCAEKAVGLEPDGIEGHYFFAVNVGAYAQAVGILRALTQGLEGLFLRHLEVALAKDDAFERSGPRLSKGRYYWELPWPRRDLEKAAAEFSVAMKQHPEGLRAWVFMAEAYEKAGKRDLAVTALRKVLSESVDYDPPEGRLQQQRARDLLRQWGAENTRL